MPWLCPKNAVCLVVKKVQMMARKKLIFLYTFQIFPFVQDRHILLSLTPPLSLSLSLTHTHSHTHIHTRTRTHTYAYTKNVISLSLSLW